MKRDYVLVDTDVVSFIFNKNQLGELYKPEIEGKIPSVSFITPAEMLFGAYNNNWGEDRKSQIKALFEDKYVVLEYNEDICTEWAIIKDHLKRNGLPYKGKDNDIWIAATAKVAGIPLISHNPGDFEGVPDLVVITRG